MKKAFCLAALGLLLSLPLIAEDRKADSPTAEDSSFGSEPSPSSNFNATALPFGGPTASEPKLSSSGSMIRRVIHTNEPYTTVDPKTGAATTQYRTVARVIDEQVPTDPQEIEKLRKQLRELQERRIDALSPAEIAAELDSQKQDAKERESWKRLQEARKLLNAISIEFPATKADGFAAMARQSIPETDKPVNLPSRAGLNPLPTY